MVKVGYEKMPTADAVGSGLRVALRGRPSVPDIASQSEQASPKKAERSRLGS